MTDAEKKALKFALEAIAIQEQIIADLINETAALVHVLVRENQPPELYARYLRGLDVARGQSYSAFRATVDRVYEVLGSLDS